MRIRKTMMIIPAFIAVILAGCSSDVITEQASSATASINNEQSPVKNNQDNSETNESGDNGEFYLESEKIKKRYIGFLKGKELLYLDVLDSYEVTEDNEYLFSTYGNMIDIDTSIGYTFDEFIRLMQDRGVISEKDFDSIISEMDYGFIDCGNDGYPEMIVHYGGLEYIFLIKEDKVRLLLPPLYIPMPAHGRSGINQYGIYSGYYLNQRYEDQQWSIYHVAINGEGRIRYIDDYIDYRGDYFEDLEDRFPEIVNYDELRHGVSVTNYTFYSENGGTKEVWSFWSDDEIISHETVEDILKKIGMPVVSDEDFNQEKEALLNEIGLSLLAENAPEPEYKSVTDVFD